MHICIISAKIPPTPCGVGDHTYQLARLLVERGVHVTLLTGQQQAASVPDPRIEVRNTIPTWGLRHSNLIVQTIRRIDPDRVLVQWVPQLYHRIGASLGLPVAAQRIYRMGIQIHVMMHELWVVPDRPLYWITHPIQKLAVSLFVNGSHSTSVSIRQWTELLREKFPHRRNDIHCVPVGSNIVRQNFPSRDWIRNKLQIDRDRVIIALFSPYGSARDFPLIESVYQKMRSAPSVQWVCIGGDRARLADRLPGLSGDPHCLFTGYLENENVSLWLQASDILFAPFMDGVCTRRGTIMAGLAHGLAIVTTRGRFTDLPLFSDSGMVLSERNAEELSQRLMAWVGDPQARRAAAEESERFHRNHFTWNQIAQMLFPIAGKEEVNARRNDQLLSSRRG